MTNIVIIGGVAGGASAAAKARRVNEFAKITVFEKGPYVSFANCGLPYYVSGEIKDRESLILSSPDFFRSRHRIRMLVRHEITKIDRDKKYVHFTNLETKESGTQEYDKLIISTGAVPIIPPIEGIDLKNIFTLRDVPDVDLIKSFLGDKSPGQAVIVGGGLIGLEMMEALVNLGIRVTLVEKLNQILPPFDRDMAMFVENHIKEKGVNVILENGVKAFERNKDKCVCAVTLEDGTIIETDMVLLSIGVRPNIQLAKDASLDLGETGAILTDEGQITSDPDIFAAGDAVEKVHGVTGKKVWIPLAGAANKEGRVAGANAAGADLRSHPVIGTAIARVFDLTVARTGLNVKEAINDGIDYYTVCLHPSDHAGYYPGATSLAIKLTAEKKTGRILGAQVIGSKGVDKTIDVFATAIHGRMSVDDISGLDLAYSPPYSSARPPVVMAGYVAGNVLHGVVETISCEEFRERLEKGDEIEVVDVRTSKERASFAIPGSRHIPIDRMRDKLNEIDRDKEIILYCLTGWRSYLAYRILKAHGFPRVKNLSGGLSSFFCGDKTSNS